MRESGADNNFLINSTPSLSGLSMSPPDGSRKKRLVWAGEKMF